MLLDHNVFFIKERVAVMKLADTYDILDPETQEPMGIAKEEPGGGITFLRLLINKRLLPTRVNVYDHENPDVPLFSMRRGVALFRAKVSIYDADGHYTGYFKSRAWKPGFWVYDASDQQVADVTGDWKGWNFTFTTEAGQQLGTVSKKWAGVAKEFFTSADNYVISIDDSVQSQQAAKVLLLAAGLAVDIIYKE